MWANPSWTNVPRHTTNFNPKIFISHIPVSNFASTTLNRWHHACAPTHPEPMLQRHTTKLQTLRCSSHTSLFRTFPEQLGTDYTTHVYQPWTTVAKTHHKTSDPKISSHTSLYWTLPEQLSLTHPSLELCRSSSPYYTTHVCQPWAKVGQNSTKPQTLRFLSHTSLFWTLPNSSPCYTTHVSQHILNQRPKTHYKLQSANVHLTHPCFELCLNNSEQMTPRMCANPSWTNIPKTHHKTSDPKVFISHIPVLNFAGAALHITPRISANPSWANVPKHTTNFRSENFHLTHPCFELCLNNSEWTNVAKTHHKTSDPKIFISHIPVLNFAGAALHITPRICANPSWTNVPKHTTNFNPKIFISHIRVLNFAEAALHITPRMCANPSWRHTTKSQTPRFSSHTSLFWTLPEQLSILHHACVPTHPEPTSQDTLQTSNPKIFISHIPVSNFAWTTRNRWHHTCEPTHLVPTSQDTT